MRLGRLIGSRTWAIGAVTFLLFMPAFGPGAWVGDGIGTSEEDRVREIDLAIIADKHGWTIEETRVRENASDALLSVSTKIASQCPDVYVGAAVGTTPYEAPALYIKGPADSYVKALIESASVAIRLIDGQPYSRDELDARQSAVAGALRAAGFRVAAGANILKRGLIEVTVGRSNGRLPSAADVWAFVPVDLRPDVSISVVDADISVDENAAFGGMAATLGSDNWCTSGWSVEHLSTGVTGWTTANHCADNSEVDGIRHPGYGIHSGVRQGRYYGQYGDVAWFTSSVPEPEKFYADHDDTRCVEAVALPGEYAVGLEVCVFGRASWNELGRGRTCAAIANPSTDCSPYGFGYDVIVTPDITIGGDSGAGWSRFSKAFGSHEGACVQGQDSRWMKTHYFDEALGVRVRIH